VAASPAGAGGPDARAVDGVSISYRDRIAECNQADLRPFVPWHAGGRRCGFVHAQRVGTLVQTGNYFTAGPDGLLLAGREFAELSEALAAVVHRLHASGHLARLHGELYPVCRDPAEAPCLQIDRAAVTWFGVRPFGVHLQAYVRRPDGIWLWLGERAATKPTFPGRLDNTAAGGLPVGLSVAANLRKECAEEASLPAEVVDRAVPTGRITYVYCDGLGLKPDTLLCYDLELPPEIEPRPADGEVAGFRLLPAREVAAIVRDTAHCKPNSALVLLEFLLRHGVLDEELPEQERTALRQALRRRLP
jgi:8-oxo-dGTP pyrophosphatase MutT (NUDIX family)